MQAGLIIPTGPVKLPPSGSGLPDRFDQKPVETGWIQIQIQINSKTPMQPVPTGLPAGFTGLPIGLTGLKFKSSRATGLPAGLTGLPPGLTGLPAGLTGGP